jgi:hypothetical protein
LTVVVISFVPNLCSSSRPTPDLIRGRAGTHFERCVDLAMDPGSPLRGVRDDSGV